MILLTDDYRNDVAAYCEAVLSGARTAGKLERYAVERYTADLEAARGNPDCPFYFDERAAVSACEFFPLLQHTDGEYSGQPFKLYPVQSFIVFNLFGWKRRDSRYRRFREAFLSMGRGNGKTPFGAALMLLLLALDDPIEDRAEVYTAAVKRDQAGLSFSAAKRFVERSGLKDYIQVLNRTLAIPDNGSKLEPLSSDGKSADGLNIHGLLRDEVHAWSEYQRDFYEKLQTALGKRRQPLAVTITTAGSEESTIWRQQHGLATRVVDPNCPTNDDSLFVFICEIDDDDDELDPDVWTKSNPLLEYGVVKAEYLADMAARAAEDPASRSQFKRYHGNKLTFSFNKSFTDAMWAQGDRPLPEDLPAAYAGVDLGWCDDIAAVGYCCPLDWVELEGQSKRRYAVFVDCFVPKGTKRPLTREPFKTWVDSGLLTVTDSEWTDTAPIYAALRRRKKALGIKSLAFDPNNAREFALNCTNELKLETFAFQQQHAKYHEALKEFKIALAEGRIFHGDDPILKWATLNVVEEENSKGHRMPAKGRSEDKIDPFVAVLMGFSECLYAERKKPSVYETRGPILF